MYVSYGVHSSTSCAEMMLGIPVVVDGLTMLTYSGHTYIQFIKNNEK